MTGNPIWRRDLKYLLDITQTQARLAAGLGASEPSICQWLDGTSPTAATQALLGRMRADAQYRIAWLYGHLGHHRANSFVEERHRAKASDLSLVRLLSRAIHDPLPSVRDFGGAVVDLVGRTLDCAWSTSGDYALLFKPDPSDPDFIIITIIYPNLEELTTTSCGAWLEPFVQTLCTCGGD